MTNLGPGPSRTLDPTGRQFQIVVMQQGRPPMDADFNLDQQVKTLATQQVVSVQVPSGWVLSEGGLAADYQTNPLYSNKFIFGRQRVGETQAMAWAAVNGWLVPVGGTRTGTPPGVPNDVDTVNVIDLDPPPANAGDSRVDFVFLEVWQARVATNPSATNKPSATALWRYGNVEGGFSFLPDDLIDPTLGRETSTRVQLQYRIRVVKGLLGFSSYPDGFDPAVVKAQGAASAPTAYTFQNMRAVLDDPGLWRAGDGTVNGLGTVDGYVYAIPICAVFRRNGVAWAGDPAQNLNGGFNRNPTAVDRTGAKILSTVPTLAADLTAAANTLTLVSATNIPLPASPASPVYIQIGDEIMTYAGITGVTLTGLARGPAVAGSRAEAHPTGSTIKVLSGRPDGLYADQVASTDILDLRHAVNPNGFDYQALLRSNLTNLLRGQLRANWKRSGSGTQGSFVAYQDKVALGAAALGVTKLDGPDNIRQVFSDAAATQDVYAIVAPSGAALPAPVGVAWALSLQVNQTVRAVANQFNPTDVLVVPVAQLKSGLPGGDADQVRWLVDGVSEAVEVRLDGETTPLDASTYTVTPASPSPTSDLTITLGASFPAATTRSLYITLRVQYGPGRGLSRRPDAVHSVEYVNPTSDILVQQPKSAPSSNLPTRVSLAALWSKYRKTLFQTALPVTAESYVDVGSKTLVLNPLRRVDMPDVVTTMDGTAANTKLTTYASGLNGVPNGTTTFTDGTVNFGVLGAVAGDALVLTNGTQPGRYVVVSVLGPTTLLLDRPVPTSVGLVTWLLFKAQGLMPLLKVDAVTPKWTTTDPLELFSGTTDPDAATKNLYVSLPDLLTPGWGEYRVPLLWQDSGPFAEGINFGFLTGKGAGPYPTSVTNFIPFSNGALTFGLFSTVQLQDPVPLPNPTLYNTKYTVPVTYAGMRKFTDTRGMGRQGLELPPFYGIARLWAVYEANDYKTNGSAYSPTTRVATGSLTAAKNLLRQNFTGPLFWVELDADGDSTFILNADALDLTKSTNFPVTSFSDAGANFVIEASLFGFDRGAFAGGEFRVVLTRVGSPGYMRSEANGGVRTSNLNLPITGSVCVLPGPPTGSDQVLVNYSRTPYQGDAWGSQTAYQDVGYLPGALTSANAYQLSSTSLDQATLSRPNQKSLEILAAVDFATTLGTGRWLGFSDPGHVPENVGYEDTTLYPPTSPIAARPKTLPGALVGDTSQAIGSEFLGCTERLPLGALWRDKDFRGQQFQTGQQLPLVISGNRSHGGLLSLARQNTLEVTDVVEAHTVSGALEAGDLVVQVDGEQGNYSLLTNYRTTRGGSAFSATSPFPGGEVRSYQTWVSGYLAAPKVNMLAGTAYLVRNTVTSVGASEVSAGDELMLLVVTTVWPLTGSLTDATLGTMINTNGTFEGWSASDLYRIEGRPLRVDGVRRDVTPSTIALAPLFFRKPL